MSAIHECGGVIYMPGRHEILSGGSPFLGSIKYRAREMGCRVADDLFLYRHRTEGSFMLAYWARKEEPRAFVELVHFKQHPDHSDENNIDEILAALRPSFEVAKEMLQKMDERTSQKRLERSTQQALRSLYARKLALDGAPGMGALVEMGMCPTKFEDDDMKLLKL